MKEEQMLGVTRSGALSYVGARDDRGFTPAVIAGGFVHVSGQASVDLASGAVIAGTFEEELRRCVANLETILAAAGSSLTAVVHVGAFVARESDLPEFNRVYRELFTHPRPSRTTWVSPIDLIQVELDAVALVETPL